MSTSYKLVCDETHEGVWIGQGNGGLKVIYSGEEDTMIRLRRFLNETQGKSLRLIDEFDDHFSEYKEYNTFYCKVCDYFSSMGENALCGYLGKDFSCSEIKGKEPPKWCPLRDKNAIPQE